MHMQHRDFFASNGDMLFELYFEPTVTEGASPVQVVPRPQNWGTEIDTTVTIHTLPNGSFTGGSLACRNKIYGVPTTGGADTTSLEIVFPAFSVLGVKVQRTAGTGASQCIFRVGWYEAGLVVEAP